MSPLLPILLLLGTTGSLLAATDLPECGPTDPAKEFNWLGQIVYLHEGGVLNLCSGAIINEGWILSNADCLINTISVLMNANLTNQYTVKNHYFVAGIDKIDLVKLGAAILYPNTSTSDQLVYAQVSSAHLFDDVSYVKVAGKTVVSGDLALLKLVKPLDLTLPQLATVCLPDPLPEKKSDDGFSTYPGAKVVKCAFGGVYLNLTNNFPTGRFYSEKFVKPLPGPQLPNDQCSKNLTELMLCTVGLPGFSEEHYQGGIVCQFPADDDKSLRWTQVGTSSFAIPLSGDDDSKTNLVFARVAAGIKWIRATIEADGSNADNAALAREWESRDGWGHDD